MSHRVLIVDDVSVNVKLLTALLAPAGYKVFATGTAEDALALLETERVDAMLLDLRLPGMDGLALARRLRADPRHATLVIIAITANAMKTDEVAALEAGCDAFITKPINTRTVVPLIAQLIEKGRAP